MKFWKNAALNLYCHATLPYRRWQNARRAKAGRAPILVLFYHRVDDDRANAWTCSTKTFERQMRWLKAHYEMVSLADAQQRIRSGRNERTCVSITFDDGYADNCRFALPLLVREQIPCTYFVAARHVFDGVPFPHDLAAGQRFAPNTIDQLRNFAAAGIEIGAHTRTHPDLGRIRDPDRLYDEVATAGGELQAAIGRPVRHFAFPYGMPENLNPLAFQIAYEAGYEGVCSAYGAFNFPGDDAFHVQRIHGDAEMSSFRNWVTIDPRKLNTPRYQYEQHTPCGTGATRCGA
jgi:peptidoglycan/xylan/chitin deacetylase (PgdA/CDA1 family)